MFTRAACQAASEFAKPYAIVGVPVLCVAWLVAGLDVDVLTLILSIVAITMTQLVLVSQGKTEELMKAQMAELIRAIPGADDALAEDPEAE